MLDALVEAFLLRLQLRELLPLDLLQLLGHFALAVRVVQQLLLHLDLGVDLLELLTCFGDLAVQIDAALNVEEDGGCGGDREDHAAQRS